MINASSRNCQVTIGGQDLTNYLATWELSDSDNNQGLITQQGKMTLFQYPGSTINLNNRLNKTLWQRGQPIVISIANQSNVVTVLKRLRILQASWDFDTKTQELEIGCVLKLIDFPVVRDCDVKQLDVVLGGGKTKTELINGFLEYFQLPPMVGTVPDSINYPIIGESESLAQLAGRLAYNAGYSLWVDQQENVIPISRRLSEVY